MIKFISTAVASVALFSAASAYGATRNQRFDAQYMQIAKLIVDTNQHAEEKLYEQMQTVASLLDRYVHQTGHLPVEANEVDEFRHRAANQLGEDPYKVQAPNPPADESICGQRQELISDLASSAKPDCRVDLRLDYELSPKDSDALESHLPDSWNACPGKICIVTNGVNLAVIWGASSSHQPIHSAETSRPIIIRLKVN